MLRLVDADRVPLPATSDPEQPFALWGGFLMP